MPMEMRLLEELAGQADLPEAIRENTVILHINHCMENSFEFSRILGKLFSKVVFTGIPYNDCRVPEDPFFIGHGAVETEPNHYCLYRGSDETSRFEGEFTDCVRSLIRQAFITDVLPVVSGGGRVLIIEDGGIHHEVVYKLMEEYPFLQDRILGSVEQTTSGTIRGQMHAGGTMPRLCPYPQLSVARSSVKMNVESVYIADRVIEELALCLYHMNTFLEFHRVLLIGYGIIGRKIAQKLQSRYTDILVIDLEPEILEVARGDGCTVCREITQNDFPVDTIIIGNTGRPSFTEEMLTAFLDSEAERLYLVSSSSQEEEFLIFLSMLRGKRPFPERVALTGHCPLDGADEYRIEYKRTDGQTVTKDICLIAKGRPVNFFRPGVISLTNCVIDLVFSEMLYLTLWLCRHPDAEKRLYLLGMDEVFSGEEIEESLFRNWLSTYHLSEEAGLRAFSDVHPAVDLLRRGVLMGNGSGKKSSP